MDKLNIRNNLYKQFLSGKYCDLHIQVENSYFKAHSCVVAAASWVLEAILQSSAAEDPNLSKLSIQLHGVTAYALSSLLCFIYTDKFPAEVYNDVEKRNQVLHAAKLYKMEDIPREFETPQNSESTVMSNLEMLESGNLNDSLLESFTSTESSEKSDGMVITNENEQRDANQIDFVMNESENSSENNSESAEPQNEKLAIEAVKEHVLQNVDYAKTHGILYCVICSKICESKADLISHMSEHQMEKARQRPERAAAVASRAGAVASLLVAANEDEDEYIDDEDYADDSNYGNESLTVPKRKRGRRKRTFTCAVCGVLYNSKGHLIRHYNNNHPEILFCKYCAEHFETVETLRIHILTHPEASETESSDKSKSNSKKYKGKKVYTCNLCSTSFLKKKELSAHQAKLHGILKPMHICTICGREFKEKSSLKAHNRVHTGEKPYTCTFCGNRFADQKTWKDHERRHRGEKPFLCTTCGKSFTYRQSFTRHMKFHEGKRPFQCSFCGKAFVLRQNLKEHEKRHNKA